MSEEILKALMQLFALVTMPGDSENLRRGVVLAFLRKILNGHRADYFINLFDDYYQEHKYKLSEKEKLHRRIASSSVKALKIASVINDELTYYQKLIVVIQLVEFLNSSQGISPVEREFIDNVAQMFHVDEVDYKTIVELIVAVDCGNLKGENFLLVSGNSPNDMLSLKLVWENVAGQLVVGKLNSTNILLMKFWNDFELTINGQLADSKQIHILRPGATLRANKCEPLYFSELQSAFGAKVALPKLSLVVKEVTYSFNSKKLGLNTMSFSSHSGNLVGIMGDSGAGKTTLVNLLCGISCPTTGCVKLNGIDIHKNASLVKGLIGYVSQDDLLIEDLTVYQNLMYNAKLCFDNLSEPEIKSRVLKILDSLGLLEIKDMKVGSPLNKNISGGQRKRLNIALELIREPSVLFLDEPTSGLSSRDSENIVDLLKELASKGKLVFVVIHQPSSDVFKMFNQLLVLDSGGYLIYNGDALASIPYFKKCVNHANYQEGECPTCGNVNAEQVLNIVHAKVLDEYGNFTPYRKIEPIEWHQKFRSANPSNDLEIHQDGLLPNLSFQIPNKIKQFWIYLQRDALSKFSNRQYILINLLEAPFLALLLASLLRYFNVDELSGGRYVFSNNPNLAIFIVVSVIIAFFIGLTLSAEEIINDRKILKRESFLDLSRLGYICSKVFLLAVISAIQMLFFVWIGNSIFGIKGMFVHYWLILFTTAVFANLLGLLISDTLKKTVNIYILIPFLVIPQLILSGVFVSYDRLNPKFSNPEVIPWYGESITARWAFEAIAVQQYAHNDYQKLFFDDEMLKSQAHYMKEYWVPTMIAKIKECKTDSLLRGQDIRLIKNEFGREYLHANKLPFTFENVLVDDAFNDSTANTLIRYLEKVRLFYRQVYNTVDNRIDGVKVKLTATPQSNKKFLALRENYYNEDFERYLRNSDRIFESKIIEYNGRLIQKSDPIFKQPEGILLKAHFFAPFKMALGYEVPTYFANLMVLWALNTFMFACLYFKVLERLFGLFPFMLSTLKGLIQ